MNNILENILYNLNQQSDISKQMISEYKVGDASVLIQMQGILKNIIELQAQALKEQQSHHQRQQSLRQTIKSMQSDLQEKKNEVRKCKEEQELKRLSIEHQRILNEIKKEEHKLKFVKQQKQKEVYQLRCLQQEKQKVSSELNQLYAYQRKAFKQIIKQQEKALQSKNVEEKTREKANSRFEQGQSSEIRVVQAGEQKSFLAGLLVPPQQLIKKEKSQMRF